MALADMYKVNNANYYETGQGMSGVFTDAIDNLLTNNENKIDYSIFINNGSTWSMKNRGCKGNHFGWYADWVGGTLAVRKGPDIHDITYLGSAVISKNATATVANLTKKLCDGISWAASFANGRFMIDSVGITPGTASQYNAFNYVDYTGIKYGFNSCVIESMVGYASSNTAYNYTLANPSTLTGDNAKRIVYSTYAVTLTGYNPYLPDSSSLLKYSVGYIWDFFEIDGELIAVRDMLNMPNSQHWQSWAQYIDGGSSVFVTIGDFGSNITPGIAGNLPANDNVKGIYSFNRSGTYANWYSTVNANYYKINSLGLRWCIGNSTISTAGEWRSNVRLGIMHDDGIIEHDHWITGESAIQASDNPNKNTDYDHIPGRGPGPGPGPYDDDPWSGVSFSGVGLGGGGAFARCYYMTSTELANLRSWMCGINVPEGFNPMAQIIGLSQVPVALSGDAPETVQFINSSAVYDPGVTSRVVDSNVSTQYSMGGPIKYSLGSVDIVRRMQERGEPYLDYSCQIELYLPLIGMFSLDTQAVMGRTIEAEAILDPISGTLAAYAWVSKDGQKLPVAYGSTTISVDLPVTAQQYSVSKAALKQANAQLGTSILSSVATLVAAAVGAGKAEGSNARVSGGASSMQGARGMNSYAQASSIAASQAAISQTGNIVGDFMQWGRTIKQLQYGNNTAISGSFGGSVAQWSYPFQAYVKINRPRYEKPENYAHTQGVPCVQKKRIGDCTGFIQCIGVDVDNHIEGATDLERQAIQAALSSGIYAGGGGE